MASNPTPPRGSSDDWQLPQPGRPQSPGNSPSSAPTASSASGSWESDAGRPTGGPPAAKGPLGPVGDALRGTFGSLWDDPRGRPLILVSLIAMIGVCALSCFVLSLALISNRDFLFSPSAASAPEAVATKSITETTNIVVNQTSMPIGIPNRLTIRNTAYTVAPMQQNKNNEWVYDPRAERTAFWASGTLVNYVLGLHASDENRAVFQSLSPGDLLLLDTAIGTLRYRVSHTETVKADEPLALSDQTRPQITLMLLGEGGDQRQAIVAAYTDEGTANSLTAPGVPVNLGDVRVRAFGERLVPGGTVGLPEGQNYYQVDIEVTSLVTRVLDATQFTSVLIDGAGAQYPLSAEGSQAAGGLGWAKGALSPGQTLTATAGFQVPAGMPGPRLELNFSTEPSNPYVARVSLPHTELAVAPTLPPTVAPVAEVALLNANISPEGNELRVVGTVRNLTDKFLTVSLRDFSLESGNLVPLNSSLPALPWSITPGETLAFQLTFARPLPGQPAVFTMFGQSFEISGQ